MNLGTGEDSDGMVPKNLISHFIYVFLNDFSNLYFFVLF
jgi:hypothetical protein